MFWAQPTTRDYFRAEKWTSVHLLVTLRRSHLSIRDKTCLQIHWFEWVWSMFLNLHFLLGTQDQRLGAEQDQLPCGFTGTSFWHLSRGKIFYGSGMSHAMTDFPKPSFKAPWRVGDAVVSRGNTGWTTSKSEHPGPCQNCSRGHLAEKTGRGSLLKCPSCPPDNPICQGAKLNWNWPMFIFHAYTSCFHILRKGMAMEKSAKLWQKFFFFF